MEVKKLREGTTLLLFLLLTRLLQIMPILVDGGANVCICCFFFFTFISLVKTKKGKQRLHVLRKKNLQLPEYILTA